MGSKLANRIRKFFLIDKVREDILLLHQAVSGIRAGAFNDHAATLKELDSLRKENATLHEDVHRVMNVFDIPASPPTVGEPKSGDPHTG